MTPKDMISRHRNVQEHKHRRKDEETSICPSIPSHSSGFRTSPHTRARTQVGNSKRGKEKDKRQGSVTRNLGRKVKDVCCIMFTCAF